jgi:predicted HTH transcriptional regulator
LYEFSTHQISFSENLHNVYRVLLFPDDFGSVILGLLLVVIGIAAGTIIFKLRNRKHKKIYTPTEIEELIKNGEDESTEFKSSLRYDYRQVLTDKNLEHEVLKAIAGFLNADGGKLMIGVDDYGEILGLENDYQSLRKKNKDGFTQRLILIFSNTFGKNMCRNIHVSFYEINRNEVCLLSVQASKKPVYLNEKNRTVFYLRTGNVTNPLTTKETVTYLNQRDA